MQERFLLSIRIWKTLHFKAHINQFEGTKSLLALKNDCVTKGNKRRQLPKNYIILCNPGRDSGHCN